MAQDREQLMREIRRKYEEAHKEERDERRMTWGTTLPREFGNDINKFLKEIGKSKVDLICAGFAALMEQYQNKN